MNYERFSELWDRYAGPVVGIDAEPQTIAALIEYGQGNTTKFQEVEEKLDKV